MLNLDQTNLAFVFTHDSHKVVFPLKIVNKRNLIVEDQETVLNDYLDYKGWDYKGKLFKLLKDLHEEITLSSTLPTIGSLEQMDKLIDVIDIDDIKYFLFDIKKLRVPSNLVREFSEQMRADGKWSKEQTFTISDYINLAAEAVRLKILLGPINYYYFINSSKIENMKIEYTLVRILLNKITKDSEAIDKVNAMVHKAALAKADYQAIVINKRLPEEELSKYVTYILMIQRIATAVIIRDNADKNIITTIHSYASSKLTTGGDVSSVIRSKNGGKGGDDEDTASVLEEYKAVTKITPGDFMKIKWVTKDVEFLLHNSPQYIIDNCSINNIRNHKGILLIYNDGVVSDFTIKLIKLIFGNTINQNTIDDLTMDNINNLVLVGYEFLMELGYDGLANLFIAKEISKTDITFNQIGKKDNELLFKLENYYFGKGEDFIDGVVSDVTSKNWINYTGPVKIPKYIYNDLMSLMIVLVENLYSKEK